jgi:hypothetical protein
MADLDPIAAETAHRNAARYSNSNGRASSTGQAATTRYGNSGPTAAATELPRTTPTATNLSPEARDAAVLKARYANSQKAAPTARDPLQVREAQKNAARYRNSTATPEGTGNNKAPVGDKSAGEAAAAPDPVLETLAASVTEHLPEGVELDRGGLASLHAAAAEAGVELTPKGIASLAAWDAKRQGASIEASRAELLKNGEASSRAELGAAFDATITHAKNALAAHDERGELTKLLNEIGAANDPRVLRFLASVGQNRR